MLAKCYKLTSGSKDKVRRDIEYITNDKLMLSLILMYLQLKPEVRILCCFVKKKLDDSGKYK